MYYLDYIVFVFFVFKQKTAYEMRISDWSSDVCSSDLTLCVRIGHHGSAPFSSLTWPQEDTAIAVGYGGKCLDCRRCQRSDAFLAALRLGIGRASCRERVCQYV